jgi:hypothetical protein
MGTAEERQVAAVREYGRADTEKDKGAWLALFADGAVDEDPVGTSLDAGLPAIAVFWDSFPPVDVGLWLEEEVIVCGREAIALMGCRTGPPDDRRESGRIADQFVFDENGEITSLRAFHNL